MDRHDEALQAIRSVIAAQTKRSAGTDEQTLIRMAAPFLSGKLQSQCRIVELAKEELLFGKGRQKTRYLYRLLRGDVSVQKEILGEVVTCQRLAPGDWLLKAQLPDSTGESTGQMFAITESASTFLQIPEREFDLALAQDALLSSAWCRELEAQMLRLQRKVERIHLHSVTKKVIHYLLTEGPGMGGEVQLPYLKSAWAAHMGMAPESLSRALKDLVDAGWLKMVGRNRLRLLRTA